MRIGQIITMIILFIIFIYLLSFGNQYINGIYSINKQNIERKVFENTQSYVEGKKQELSKYRFEYTTTEDENTKQAIRMVLLQSFANFDRVKYLTTSDNLFLDKIFNNK